MPEIIEQMLNQYHNGPDFGKKNQIKEVIQEIILCGLSRGGFFNHAAFYGGTALRIFHGLDRFSEDLDFSLTKPDPDFDFRSYLPAIENEVNAYGLHFHAEEHPKANDSDIRSAFLKGNTKEHILLFYADEKLTASIHKDETIRIKFEVDINPPMHAGYEQKYRLMPIPYAVRLYDMPSLFAGKIHAVLFRAWRNRVKGRDLYDYIYYLSKNTPVNLHHLESRLHQTGFLSETETLDIDKLKALLDKRFSDINYKEARNDVLPFIARPEKLDLWSSEFFMAITENLQAVTGEKQA
ncbi:MAG: nucleotidyl transferase AbiEii/AbiGii toxin family protein [Anaerolineaceae bacterium]|nr:nucleotidyl transferase AbiEii/AbiGii toxin family protein [Anaerolineaceae bacterium]